MEIITILGDSLDMTRLSENIYYKDTYAYKLNNFLEKEYFVINRARRTNTILKQTISYNISNDILCYKSKYTIIHLGIVDCAPRLFSEKERRILHYIKPKKIANYIIKVKSHNRYFFTKNFPKVYVNLETFKLKYNFLVDQIINKTQFKKIFIINIAKTNKKNERRSYNFNSNICTYNNVIYDIYKKYKNHIQLIDFYKMTEENPNLLLDDGIHITKEAHNILASILYKKIINGEKYSFN